MSREHERIQTSGGLCAKLHYLQSSSLHTDMQNVTFTSFYSQCLSVTFWWATAPEQCSNWSNGDQEFLVQCVMPFFKTVTLWSNQLAKAPVLSSFFQRNCINFSLIKYRLKKADIAVMVRCQLAVMCTVNSEAVETYIYEQSMSSDYLKICNWQMDKINLLLYRKSYSA